jgi:nucleoside-diphosphate-sugar epimerase
MQENRRGTTALITGGTGYLGLRLCRRLISQGFRVRLFDLKLPIGSSSLCMHCSSSDVDDYEPVCPDGAELVLGDIRNAEAVEKAMSGVQIVFHVASYGMSGAESMNKELIHQINVSLMVIC